MQRIGTVEKLRRYPFKSMAGEDLDEVFVTYAGLVGDRAYAFLDPKNPTNFPWMTGRLAREMVLFRPRFLRPPAAQEAHPPAASFRAEVRTPEGQRLSVGDGQFTGYFAKRFGRELELRFSERAMEDACPVSILGLDALEPLSQEVGFRLDPRRFRANFYVRWESRKPYYEEELVGALLQIGETLRVMAVKKDSRCVMIGIDPETGENSAEVLAAVARNHAGCFGIYGAVLREGIARANDAVYVL